MKIECLAFCNLNSLMGTHRIDFTARPLADAGLFAITGPTGSGKTTVFDAVCLALYGQTPRLKKRDARDKKTQPWQIVTRHCSEAWCELTFSCRPGRYRSRWEIHRSRKKADLDFVPQSMQLSRENGGIFEIIEDRPGSVPVCVEEVSGLSFDRFIRSVMLAQGAFDAFLQVSSQERAALLEQLTGTSIYSDLSKEAYRRFQQEHEELERLRNACNTLSILGNDERKELQKLTGSARDSARVLENEIQQMKDTLSLYAEFEETQTRHNETQTMLNALHGKAPEIGILRDRLAKAVRADSFSPDLKGLDVSETALKRERERVAQLEVRSRDLGKKLDDAGNELRRAVEQQETVREIHTGNTAKADKGREYEMSLSGLNRQLAENAAEREVLEKKRDVLLEERQKNDELMSGHIRAMSDFDVWIKLHEYGPELLESWALVESRLKERCSFFEEQKRASARRTELQEKYEELEHNSSVLEARLAIIEKNLAEKKEEIAECHNLIGQGRDTEKRLQKIQDNIARTEEWEKLETERNELMTRLSVTGRETECASEAIARLKAELSTPETVTVLSSLLRRQLTEGKPCSVCGSILHPAVVQGEPEIDNTDIMEDIVFRFEKLNEMETQLQIKQTEHEYSEKDMEACIQRQHSLLAFPPEYASAGKYREEILNKDYAVLEARARDIRDAGERLVLAEKFRDDLEREAVEIRRNLEECVRENGRISLGIEELDRNLAGMDARCSEIEAFLERFGGADTVEEIHAEGNELSIRAKLASVEASDLDADKIRITQSLAICDERIAEVVKKTVEYEHDAGVLREKINHLAGGKDLTVFIAESEQTLKDAEAASNGIQNAITSMEAERATVAKEAESGKKELASMEEVHNRIRCSVNERALAEGFGSLEKLCSFLLSPDERKAMESGIHSHERDIHEYSVKAEELNKALTVQVSRLSGAAPREELPAGIRARSDQRDTILSESGAAENRLKHDDENRMKKTFLDTRIETQETVFEVWNRMKSLIGSRDGTAFQRFAQSVTLDRLIENANTHLRALSSRYILGRRDEENLSLEITDTWQGDILRPVTTLSGGETFIVSLSLALGLSGLVSNRIRIETLFLDEGFGTLDSATLETVLSVLETVRAGGKQIGVISHVDALKERIGVKIEISPVGNGHSRLEVVG